MRRFAKMFSDFANLQVALAGLTWYHLQCLMDKVPDKSMSLWHADKSLENGWSRNVLFYQIEFISFSMDTKK